MTAQPPSDDEQPPFDDEQTPASLVTPLPPSPSKKRKTDEDHTSIDNIANIDIDMEEESNNLLIDEMGLLTWDDVHTMLIDPLRKYLTAYAVNMNYPVSESFFIWIISEKRSSYTSLNYSLHVLQAASSKIQPTLLLTNLTPSGPTLSTITFIWPIKMTMISLWYCSWTYQTSVLN